MKHFSHDHKLRLRFEMPKRVACSLCEDPVVGPNYGCYECTENFILHKSCANLQREILK